MRRCLASQDGRDAVRKSRKGADPVARGIRRRASKNLADARHRPRSFSYPTDPTRDLYGSISLSLGIRPDLPVCSRSLPPDQERDRTSATAHIASTRMGIIFMVRPKVQPDAINCMIVRTFRHIKRFRYGFSCRSYTKAQCYWSPNA